MREKGRNEEGREMKGKEGEGERTSSLRLPGDGSNFCHEETQGGREGGGGGRNFLLRLPHVGILSTITLSLKQTLNTISLSRKCRTSDFTQGRNKSRRMLETITPSIFLE